jgi:hypothetical protein
MTKEYLSIRYPGMNFINVWVNDKKTKPEHPDFVGNGVAVWKRSFEEKKEEGE